MVLQVKLCKRCNQAPAVEVFRSPCGCDNAYCTACTSMGDFQRWLAIMRCYECGRFWAYERCGHNASCPFCAKAKVERARAHEEKAQRAASSLKGAYSKLKSRVYKVVDPGSATKPFVLKRGRT